MKINGPVSEMDLQLTSDPPLTQNTIVRMLTLQRESAGSNEVTGDDMANLMTVGLQMTVCRVTWRCLSNRHWDLTSSVSIPAKHAPVSALKALTTGIKS